LLCHELFARLDVDLPDSHVVTATEFRVDRTPKQLAAVARSTTAADRY
jgi:hypothetical protein